MYIKKQSAGLLGFFVGLIYAPFLSLAYLFSSLSALWVREGVSVFRRFSMLVLGPITWVMSMLYLPFLCALSAMEEGFQGMRLSHVSQCFRYASVTVFGLQKVSPSHVQCQAAMAVLAILLLVPLLYHFPFAALWLVAHACFPVQWIIALFYLSVVVVTLFLYGFLMPKINQLFDIMVATQEQLPKRYQELMHDNQLYFPMTEYDGAHQQANSHCATYS